MLIEWKDRDVNTVLAIALCDTGNSGTIILKEKVQKGKVHFKKNRTTKWKTTGVVFQSLNKCKNNCFSRSGKLRYNFKCSTVTVTHTFFPIIKMQSPFATNCRSCLFLLSSMLLWCEIPYLSCLLG